MTSLNLACAIGLPFEQAIKSFLDSASLHPDYGSTVLPPQKKTERHKMRQ